MAESAPLLDKKRETPLPTFTFAKDTPHGKRPQAIAHRGYKAMHPENTMGAFKAAVELGVDALEVDIHLTQDRVVVLSHDPTLKRCFGKEDKIVDCNWEYLQTLRTLKNPQPMPSLRDLLEYLASPGLDDIWVLLDIKLLLPSLTDAMLGTKAAKKLDDYADDLFRAIAATFADVKPSSRPWNQRILLGCWAAKYLPLCTKHLPEYPITHIGFSVDYARQFLKVPRVGLNLFQSLMVGPRGTWLLREVKRQKADRTLLFWTVNEESWMKWSIRQEVDGVITDNPQKYLEVRKAYNKHETISHTWASWKNILGWHWIFMKRGFSFRVKHGYWVDVQKVKKNLEGWISHKS
ncbi:glycerophosphoryl diester phosphodiesterase [Talaromyces islandicus]|uniref:Glycerophosphoryl diester phosphodiesterase n=1 Tax=Talaromyces islandicus TaxID=28573 RepID=A0A0U1M9K8_TALIS|nr:glycerophosphoryl diester phosphodiesterase [Talaromyces islandicus]